MKDRVAATQAEELAKMFLNYSNSKRLGAAMRHPECQKDLFAVIDVLGEDHVKMWRSTRKFYKSFFGFDCPKLELLVPKVEPGFNWILPIFAIDSACPIEATYQALAKNFKCRRSVNVILEEVVTRHVRDPRQKPYIIRLRDREEADEELKNLSADDLDNRLIKGNTLLESMILEGWYFVETGKHLNLQNANMCTASRSRRGYVPYVRWDHAQEAFDIEAGTWCDPSRTPVNLRARQVISLEPFSLVP